MQRSALQLLVCQTAGQLELGLRSRGLPPLALAPQPCSEATRTQCGDGPSPSPSPNPHEPSQQCVADFNAAMKGPCGQGSTVSMCCSAVKGLGSCLDDIMAVMAQKAEYAGALKQL